MKAHRRLLEEATHFERQSALDRSPGVPEPFPELHEVRASAEVLFADSDGEAEETEVSGPGSGRSRRWIEDRDENGLARRRRHRQRQAHATRNRLGPREHDPEGSTFAASYRQGRAGRTFRVEPFREIAEAGRDRSDACARGIAKMLDIQGRLGQVEGHRGG